MLGSWVRAPAGSPEKGRSRPSFFRFREGEIFVFGKERPVLSGRFPRIGRVRSTLSGKQVDVFPLPAAGTFEFRRLAATLADRRAADAVFGGGFPKRVKHLTGGDAPYLPFRLRRRSIALTEHFRQPEERDFAMRPYACADHTWPQALHSNVMRVWLLTYSVRGTISGCNRFNLSTNRSCESFNLPAQLAHPEPRRRVVGATDHS